MLMCIVLGMVVTRVCCWWCVMMLVMMLSMTLSPQCVAYPTEEVADDDVLNINTDQDDGGLPSPWLATALR